MSRNINLAQLTDLLDQLARLTDKNLEFHHLITLLHVARAGGGGITVPELERLLPYVPPSGIARTLARLHQGPRSDTVRNIGQGLGLVSKAVDPEDWRRHRWVLSREGLAVFRRVGLID